MDLIISPHVDDEVLGCGGILSKNHTVLHCGLSEGFRHGDIIFSKDFRLQEFDGVKKLSGCKTILLNHPVNNYCRNKLIGDFETTINSTQPEKLYIPNPSYNQDHKEVYDAALIALRPHDITKKISLYEEMNSQVRGHRSTKHVKTIAELRGMQSNHEHAEAFEILRWLD